MFVLNHHIANDLKTRMGPAYTENVTVNNSLIRGAGLGLFATADFQAGQLIGVYAGDIITQDAAALRDSDYMATIPNCETVVDSRDKYCCFTRYANDCITDHELNADFTVFPEQAGLLWLEANQDIDAGEEIYVSYGDDYFNDINRFSSLSTRSQYLYRNSGRDGAQDFVDSNFTRDVFGNYHLINAVAPVVIDLTI
jgi:hypothetical protein